MSQTTAFAGNDTSSSLPSILRSAISRVQAGLEGRRARARLRWELNQYTDRELADIGLSRSDIDGIAANLRTR